MNEKIKDEPSWAKYGGDYEKEMYDILTKDEEIVRACWPNTGYFNETVEPHRHILETDVTHCRIVDIFPPHKYIGDYNGKT